MKNYISLGLGTSYIYLLMLIINNPSLAQKIRENYLPKLPKKDSTKAKDLIILNSETQLLVKTQKSRGINTTKNNDFLSAFVSLLGDGLYEPTALQGATRKKPVLLGSNQSGGVALPDIHFQQDINANQNILFSNKIGTNILNFDAQYSYLYQDEPRQGWGIDIFNQRSYLPAFINGEKEVNLSNGNTPWLHRLGGGVEYAFPITNNFGTAVGISYQNVSVRDDMFSSNVEAKDELGNPFTASSDGHDLLLTTNLSAFYEDVDDPSFPKKGSRFRFGLDQAIPIGNTQVDFTRINGSYSQFIPLFIKNDTLIVNLQAGTIFGDIPAYEAFTLGGHGSVRGYKKGGVGTGSSFVLASAEYRFPITSFRLISNNIDLHGSLFIDYGSDLGTANDVIGNPADARDKPGDGFGYGFGLLGNSSFGPIRLELGFSDRGDTRLEFTISDRF